MIYIHTYGIGKFSSKQMRNVHDTLDEALAQQRVLGGVIQAFESVENIAINESIKDLVLDEVSCIIDDYSTRAPGFDFEPGSPEWYCRKIIRLNVVRNLLSGI